MEYWLIKLLLLGALVVVAYFMMRPAKTASHLALRRMGFMTIVVVAGLAVVFPSVVHRIAGMLGVASGVNLLIYMLILIAFMQMATSYRRDSATDRRLTLLARAQALDAAPKPPRGPAED